MSFLLFEGGGYACFKYLRKEYSMGLIQFIVTEY